MRKWILLPAIAGTLTAQVSFDRLLHARSEPQNWLTYSGDYSSERYSLLDRITPQNVKNLELKWVFQARSLEKFESTPLVADGVMYFTEAPNHLYAVDPQDRPRLSGITNTARRATLGCAVARSTAASRSSTARFSWGPSTVT